MEYLTCGLREVKFDSAQPETMTFSGYGAVFGNVDANGNLIEPGAFADTIAQARKSGEWPPLLSQHGGLGLSADDLVPIGVITDLAEDGKGLRMSAKLADTERGLEYYKLMRMEPRPAINGLSIGYIPKEWTPRSKPDEPRRRLKKVDLIEISLVTFPANPKARVHNVNAIERLERLSECERYLRESCGMSRQEALAFISRVKSFVSQSESASDDVAELFAPMRRLLKAMTP